MNIAIEPDAAEARFTLARSVLIAYLNQKVEMGDWHGVRDCAVDIELLEAKHSAQFSHLT